MVHQFCKSENKVLPTFPSMNNKFNGPIMYQPQVNDSVNAESLRKRQTSNLWWAISQAKERLKKMQTR